MDMMDQLMEAVNAIASIGEYRQSHRKECLNLVRRFKLLIPLFEEVMESQNTLCHSASECFQSLLQILSSAKQLLHICHNGSKLYLALEGESVMGKFYAMTEELDLILDRMPYDSLEISVEVKEQVELMHQQLKRVKRRTNTQDVELSMDILVALSQKNDRNADIATLRRLAGKLQLQTVSELTVESRAVKKFIKEKGAEMGETAQQMNYILTKLKEISRTEFFEETRTDFEKFFSSKITLERADSSPSVPEDFLCPISLELMRDPVIVATGQTYERESITKWWNSGHKTCPKTQQVISQLTLTPNYVLKSLITQWCETNKVQLPRRASLARLARITKICDFSSGNRANINMLVQNLTSQQIEVQRGAAEELRALAKRNSENRIGIAEAGGIPPLIKLLNSYDLKTQEHAVTALLNLSIHDTNKTLIVEQGGIEPIVEVLTKGSMEARENSAAALFSLSIKEENKATIGGSGAIKALVNLLGEGTTRGKKDAVTALFNLCMLQGNKGRAVRAGVVPLLLQLLLDRSAGMVDEALAILSILATNKDGRAAIGNLSAIHTIVRFICSGSPRNKENAAAVLLALTANDPAHLLTALQLGVHDYLLELVQSGTTRARRKANSLLELTRKAQLISKNASSSPFGS